MRTLMREMKSHLMKGEALVLVTVIAASGSVPRGAGARMLVSRAGRLYGSIGGGAVEHQAQLAALEVLNDKCSLDREYTLNHEDKQNLGMICGGRCSVFFHYIAAGDNAVISLAEQAEQSFAAGEDLWLISDLAKGGSLSLIKRKRPGSSDQDVSAEEIILGEVSGGGLPARELPPYLTHRPCRWQQDGQDLFAEQICTSSTVYVFGGGHVAQELVPVLSHVGFRCVVMEDREEFTRRELFPTAERIILGDFNHISESVTLGSEDYACIMTRGHAYDTVLQAQILKCHPCYCGVIGSRSKAAGVRKALKEDYGLMEEELERITTPIGLPIQAVTPAEIAISIAAQMIQHRAERNKEK